MGDLLKFIPKAKSEKDTPVNQKSEIGVILNINTPFKEIPKKLTKKQKEKEAKSSIMERLAREAGLNYDGGDNRLFYDDDRIDVYASDMTKKEYSVMEKALKKFQIKRKHYFITAWNDISGYDHWSSLDHEANYIQITVHVTNPEKANAQEIKKNVMKAYSEFYYYDNSDEHDFSKNRDMKEIN